MEKTPITSKAAILSLGFFYVIILLGMVRSNAVVAQTWKIEWEKTLAAAKKEGKLVLYIGGGYDAVLSAFRKRYPEIKVTTVTGRGSQQSLKIMAERRAEKYLADVYSGGPTTPHKVSHDFAGIFAERHFKGYDSSPGSTSGRSRLPHYRSTCIDGHEAHLQTREQNPSLAREKIRRSSWPTKDQIRPEESLLTIV